MPINRRVSLNSVSNSCMLMCVFLWEKQPVDWWCWCPASEERESSVSLIHSGIIRSKNGSVFGKKNYISWFINLNFAGSKKILIPRLWMPFSLSNLIPPTSVSSRFCKIWLKLFWKEQDESRKCNLSQTRFLTKSSMA